MHFLTVIWQLKTRYRKTMSFVLAVIAKNCNLKDHLPHWMSSHCPIVISKTVILHITVMEQMVVPVCEVHTGCPLNSAPVYWTRISDVDTEILFLSTMPSKHLNYLHGKLVHAVGAFPVQELSIFFNAGSSIALFMVFKREILLEEWGIFFIADLAHNEICIPKVSCPNFLRKLLL